MINPGMKHTFMVLSDEPLTNRLLCKCRHLTVPECPAKVRAAHTVLVLLFHTCYTYIHNYLKVPTQEWKMVSSMYIVDLNLQELECCHVRFFIELYHG